MAASPAWLMPPIATDTPLAIESVKDPSLGGIAAATIHYPQGWHIEAAVVPNTGYVTFRAYSPDGLSELRVEPVFVWDSWQGNVDAAASWPRAYPERWHQPIAFAADYAAAVNVAQAIGPMAVGDPFRRRWQTTSRTLDRHTATQSGPTVRNSFAIAALQAQQVNGAFTIEQRIRVRSLCTRPVHPPRDYAVACSVVVDVLRAPLGRFDPLRRYVDAQNLPEVTFETGWQDKVHARAEQAFRSVQNTLRWSVIPEHVFQPSVEKLNEQRQQRVTRPLRAHQEAQLVPDPSNRSRRQETVHRPLPPFWAPARAALFDWTDYALALIEADVNNTPVRCRVHRWSRADGQEFSTANAAANPNGLIEGTWSEKQEPMFFDEAACNTLSDP